MDDHCRLCSRRPCTLHHILNNCQAALSRYTWRHDSILQQLADLLHKQHKRRNNHKVPYITFVRQGQTAPAVRIARRPVPTPLFESALDWEIIIDLPNGSAIFVPDILVTASRPDIVLLSRETELSGTSRGWTKAFGRCRVVE